LLAGEKRGGATPLTRKEGGDAILLSLFPKKTRLREERRPAGGFVPLLARMGGGKERRHFLTPFDTRIISEKGGREEPISTHFLSTKGAGYLILDKKKKCPALLSYLHYGQRKSAGDARP